MSGLWWVLVASGWALHPFVLNHFSCLPAGGEAIINYYQGPLEVMDIILKIKPWISVVCQTQRLCVYL